MRGKVMEIGGLKEKSLAALRVGVKTIVVPKANKKDLSELPKEVRQKLKFVFAAQMDDVIKAALR